MAESQPVVNMRRLVESPTPKTLWLIVLLAFPVMAAFFFYLRGIDRQLAPYGIVPFEFAFTPARAREMISAWGQAGSRAARQSLLVDFGFMPAYAIVFAGLTLSAARAAKERWQTLGLGLTLAPFGAWLFDAIENGALLSTLSDSSLAVVVALAGVSAAVKFSLLLLCLAYMLGVLVVSLIRRSSHAH